MRMRGIDWLTLLALSTVWGTSFVCYKLLDDAGYPPLTIAAARVVLAALVLVIFGWLRGRPLVTAPRTWRDFGVMGVFNNIIPYVLIAWAESHLPSGIAAILNATTPVFSVLVVWITSRNAPRLNVVAGIALAFAGVAVVVGPAAFVRLDPRDLAQLACLLAALSYAIAGTFGRRFHAAGIDPVTTTSGQLVVSSALLIPLSLIERPWLLPAPTAASWAALIVLAVVATSVAYVLYFSLLRSAGPTNALLSTMLVPVSALALGALFLGERLELRELGGMLLIAGGLLAVDGRAFTVLRSPQRC